MIGPPEWWATFFEGEALRFWRRAIPDEVTEREVEATVRRLRLSPGDRVLDVPCGAGRHALRLAERGLRVTAVDLCPEFVEEVADRAAEQGLDIELAVREMRDLPWRRRFRGALCLGNSFAYLAGDGNERFLRAVARTLEPGGGLLLQTGVAAESVLPGFAEHAEHHAGGYRVTTRSRYHALRGTLSVDYTFAPEDADRPVESKTAEYRVYTVRQICEMLRAAGLAVIEPVPDESGRDFAPGDPLLTLVARKPQRAPGR